MSRNIKLTIEYFGADYLGWQIQPGGPTVQGSVVKALSELCGEDIHTVGVSRTDAGVHANNFVLNFFTDSTIPADRFALALNSFLPSDIVAKSSEEVPPEFHARFCAKRKTYRYLFYFSPVPSARLYQRAWHIKRPDFEELSPEEQAAKLKALNDSASHFLGTHDFSAFKAVGASNPAKIRTIYAARVFTVPANLLSGRSLLCFEITGDGFLYNMVRIMTGTLVGVYEGRFTPEEIPEIIDSCDRTRAGMTAPPDGLYLDSVEY